MQWKGAVISSLLILRVSQRHSMKLLDTGCNGDLKSASSIRSLSSHAVHLKISGHQNRLTEHESRTKINYVASESRQYIYSVVFELNLDHIRYRGDGLCVISMVNCARKITINCVTFKARWSSCNHRINVTTWIILKAAGQWHIYIRIQRSSSACSSRWCRGPSSWNR